MAKVIKRLVATVAALIVGLMGGKVLRWAAEKLAKWAES